MNKLKLLEELRKEVTELKFQDENTRDALTRKAEMLLRNFYGEGCKYLDDLDEIDYWPGVYPTTDQRERETWLAGQKQFINLLNTLIEEANLFDAQKPVKNTKIQSSILTNDVFIVHGHDEAMKQAVARSLQKLDLNPIILHEKPNQGKTIIEKFTEYAKVSFAIVLLSPDDKGFSSKETSEKAKFRARQNVILELGYFLGKLGRDRVLVLYKESKNFEMPSDYSGILFVPFDSGNRWQFDLAKELKACGFDIDANKIL